MNKVCCAVKMFLVPPLFFNKKAVVTYPVVLVCRVSQSKMFVKIAVYFKNFNFVSGKPHLTYN